jgi:AraC-like DNA-binding protein
MPDAIGTLKVSSLIAQQCLNLGKSKGISLDKLLSESGMSYEQVKNPQAWVPFICIERLIHYSLNYIKDPLIGLHGAPHINMAALGVLGYVLQTSSTLQGLIETSSRFEQLLSNVGTTQLHHEPGAALWRWDCNIPDPVLARHAAECVLGCWAGQLRLLIQQRTPTLRAVRFCHAAPADKNLLREYEEFFRCPVAFDQPNSELVLVPSALSQTLMLANPDLHQTLEQHAHVLLNTHKVSSSITHQVRDLLRTQLLQGASPDREQVAALLGMSGRSLYRHLQEAGSSYREVFDALRLEMAQAALRDGQHSVSAIAQQLGFQESQSFIRWFRQMANITPGEFRQKYTQAQ